MRPSHREPNQLRPITLTRQYTRHAEGSVLVEFGQTRVLCTASVMDGVPRFLKGKNEGWITAEYGMLPRATHSRNEREASKGKQGGRTLEIQRLIGRSLRACLDLKTLGEYTITLDCDVLQAERPPSPVLVWRLKMPWIGWFLGKNYVKTSHSITLLLFLSAFTAANPYWIWTMLRTFSPKPT